MRFIQNCFSNSKDPLKYNLKKLLGYTPKKIDLFHEAFTHSSAQIEDENSIPINYQRLEFLGDAILDMVVSDFLFHLEKEKKEGYLTKMRIKLVNRKKLNFYGIKWGFQDLIISKLSDDQTRGKVIGDVVEAFLGALYLAHGFKICKLFIYKHMIPSKNELKFLENQIFSNKSYFIEWCQHHKHHYSIITYPSEQNVKDLKFQTEIMLNDNQKFIGKGSSKKLAEENAAFEACKALSISTNII